MSKWSIESWKSHSVNQAPGWESDSQLSSITNILKHKPPIVFKDEIDLLKKRLSKVEEGKCFIVQGGDCAETFADLNTELIKNKLNILLQMSTILSYATSIETLRIGRIAGQFSKPRTELTEIQNNQEYPSYRGDAINGLNFSQQSRTPTPSRMIKAYDQSSFTLNLIRSMINSGYTNILNAHNWDLDFIKNSPQVKKYNNIIAKIQKALSFISTVNDQNYRGQRIELYEFFTSHEGLLLDYEQALTKYDVQSKKYYDYSGHMIWVGDRTRKLNGAHIEFVSGIANPIGIKVGPSIDEQELVEVIKKVNPKNEKGKIILIARLGLNNIEDMLPPLIKIVNKNKLNAIWICDPMHGNTYKNKQGLKTRHFNTILKELSIYMSIHKKLNSNPGGIHIEFTSQDVTECLGGYQNIDDELLMQRYQTACDPRLNNQQSLELIFKLTDLLEEKI
tara:strand:+ start:92 stop:1438 length:1347 start_codon:yes stop_codon:yes gene_type:complete